jgi:undecaprenyl pyrophosphate phosphatase UppP
MTNQQQALIDTLKAVISMVLIGFLVTVLLGLGYGTWLGYTLITAILVYGVIIIYEINLNRIEYRQRLQDMVDKK